MNTSKATNPRFAQRIGSALGVLVFLVAGVSLADERLSDPSSSDRRLSAPDSTGLVSWSPMDTLFHLPPVEVEGWRVRRHEARERQSLASTVISPADHPRRQVSLDEILREVSGLELRRMGGLGAFSTASLRGSSGQEVAVLLDGLDLRSPFTGMALLDELPLSGIQRIEVFRGGVPGDLGGGSAAGAVHVLTGDAASRRLALSAGSFGTRRGSFMSGGMGPWGLNWWLALGLQNSDANFNYLDRNGTTVSNTADDTLRVRRNADFAGRDLLTRLRWDAPADLRLGRWELSYRYLRRDNGIPGTEALPTYHTRSERSGHDARLSWESTPMPGRWRLGLAAYLLEGRSRFHNPADESGPFLLADETLDRLGTRGLKARTDLYLLPLHLLIQAERRDDRFLPENLNPAKGKGYERTRRRERVETEGRLLLAGERVLLAAAYGEEWLADNYYGPPPLPWLPALPRDTHTTHAVYRRAGARLKLLDRRMAGARWALSISANAGDSYRAPTLLELFGQDVSIRGNPELLPETGMLRDLGLSLHYSRGAFRCESEISIFDREMEQQIVFLRNSQSSLRAENLSASDNRGCEILLELRLHGLWAQFSATVQDARDRSDVNIYDGKSLPYRTPRRLFTRLGGEKGRLSAFADFEQRSAVHTNRYNDPDGQLPASFVWGAGLRWRLAGQLSLSADGLNLGDERIEDVHGYPLPGRTWMVGIEWTSTSSRGD